VLTEIRKPCSLERAGPSGEVLCRCESDEAKGAPINYVVLQKGTVVLPSPQDNGATNHINTRRIAYTIEGIRGWLFAQHK
jgi:predicted peptidase